MRTIGEKRMRKGEYSGSIDYTESVDANNRLKHNWSTSKGAISNLILLSGNLKDSAYLCASIGKLSSLVLQGRTRDQSSSAREEDNSEIDLVSESLEIEVAKEDGHIARKIKF